MSDTLRSVEEVRERSEALAYEEWRASREKPVQSDYATLQTFNLRVMGPEPLGGHFPSLLSNMLSEAEENISDVLPKGYYVKIEEWFKP